MCLTDVTIHRRLLVPFLTALDSRALVKGSRDPLGIQPIWTRLGRNVVGNLTTVTDSVRDFSILLTGLYLCEQAAAKGPSANDVQVFLRWEQLAGYVRHRALNQSGFRGTERVAKQVAATGGKVTLSHDPAFQILGDQQTYGLWGLYTTAARASGLVQADRPRLTPTAAERVESETTSIFAKHGTRLRDLVDVVAPQRTELDMDGKHKRLVGALAELLRPQLRPPEGAFYRQHLVHGLPLDPTHGRQQRLAQLFYTNRDVLGLSIQPAVVAELARQAAAPGDAIGRALAGHLERIRVAESVLALANEVFSWSLGFEGDALDAIARRITAAWGTAPATVLSVAFANLRSEIREATGQAATADTWCDVARAFSAGQYVAALEGLLTINRLVMHGRGGAPWAEIRDGKLTVQYKDESGRLPTPKQLADLWRFSYFLEPLRSVTLAVEGAA